MNSNMTPCSNEYPSSSCAESYQMYDTYAYKYGTEYIHRARIHAQSGVG